MHQSESERPTAAQATTQVSDDPDDVTIFADEAVRVSFENAHDGRPNGGYGVKNNFKLDENKQYQYTGDNVSTD